MENEASKSLVIRLSVLKTNLGVNWQELASSLGISRQTLTTAKASGKLNARAMAKLIELENKCQIGHDTSQKSSNGVKEEHVEVITKELDFYRYENDRLRIQVEKLQSNLDAAHTNLTSVTESLVVALKIISNRNKEDDEKRKRGE